MAHEDVAEKTLDYEMEQTLYHILVAMNHFSRAHDLIEQAGYPVEEDGKFNACKKELREYLALVFKRGGEDGSWTQ